MQTWTRRNNGGATGGIRGSFSCLWRMQGSRLSDSTKAEEGGRTDEEWAETSKSKGDERQESSRLAEGGNSVEKPTFESSDGLGSLKASGGSFLTAEDCLGRLSASKVAATMCSR